MDEAEINAKEDEEFIRTQSAMEILSNHQSSTLRYALNKKLQGLKFFGKTGTTNSGFDTWFVGFDGKNLAVVWVGWEGDRVKGLKFKNFGSNTAFPVFQNWVLNRGQRFQELHCESIPKRKVE